MYPAASRSEAHGPADFGDELGDQPEEGDAQQHAGAQRDDDRARRRRPVSHSPSTAPDTPTAVARAGAVMPGVQADKTLA